MSGMLATRGFWSVNVMICLNSITEFINNCHISGWYYLENKEELQSTKVYVSENESNDEDELLRTLEYSTEEWDAYENTFEWCQNWSIWGTDPVLSIRAGRVGYKAGD